MACSIHGIVAAAAPVAVLFRRGPTLRTELIRWDTSRDRFERGQWFHGRIYTRRSDLSPDGALLVYFAAKHGRRLARDTGYTDTWTAVSRPPYYTALALWPKGDAWDGGGWFAAPRELHLNHPGAAAAHPAHPVSASLRVHVNRGGRGEDLPILDDVLSAKGWWRIPGSQDDGRALRAVRGPHVWLRRHPRAELVLRMELEGWNPQGAGGPLHFGYALAHPDGTLVEVLEATWADWDHAGRLVFSDGGRIYARTLDGRHDDPSVALADFTEDVPSPVIAPEWAGRWP
jgi:hypothetical protein